MTFGLVIGDAARLDRESQPNDGVVVHRDGVIIYANACAHRLFKARTTSDLVGTHPLDRVHPDDQPAAVVRIASGVTIGNPIIKERLVALDGSTFMTEVTNSPIMFNGVPAVLCVFTSLERSVWPPERPPRNERERESNYRAAYPRRLMA